MSSIKFLKSNDFGAICLAFLLIGMAWLSHTSKPLIVTTQPAEQVGPQSGAVLIEKDSAPIRYKLPGLIRKAKSIEWFVEQRTFPTGTVPPDADLKALEYVRVQMLPALRQKRLAKGSAPVLLGQTLSWIFRGPGNVGGRVRGLVVDPTNINVIYVGSVSGGVWKSTDGGLSWFPTMNDEASLNVSALVMKPGEPMTLYAGTGEAFLNLGYLPGRGVFKTIDGGQTWMRLHEANGLKTSFITELAISPANPSIIYASGRKAYPSPNNPSGETTPDIGLNAIFKSTNEGLTWTDITTGKGIDHVSGSFDDIPADLVVSPLSPDTIFAAFGLFSGAGGIWKSVNGGQTWTRLRNGLPDPLTLNNGYERIELAMAPSNSRVLYASFSYNKKSGDTNSLADAELLGIWKTVDGGANWTKVTTPLSTAQININGGRKTALGQQGWYNNTIHVHPTDPNTVFVGGIDIYKSTDGGNSWQQITLWVSGRGFPYVHADQHVFTFYTGTNPPTLFAGNDGGIYKSADLGINWRELNNSLGVTQFYFFAAHPTNPNILLGGSQDNGSPMLVNGGINDWGDLTSGDGGPAYFDEEFPSTVYASIYNLGMRRYTSFDYTTGNYIRKDIGYIGGANGITQADMDSAAFFGPYELSPNNSAVLVLGTYRVLKSTNQGDQWTPISARLAPGAPISTVAIASGNDNIVWAATKNARIFKTENNGASWTEVTRSNLPNRFVSDIEFQPSSGSAVYLTYSGYTTAQYGKSVHVFKSTSAGGTWTDITNNLPDVPVNTIEVHPSNSNLLFIGTDIGVFLSDDGGATWEPANNGFPATQVVAIKLNTTTDRIVAATHGRGVFDARLSTVGVAEPPTAIVPRSPMLDQNYPNPFNPLTTIAYELFGPAMVTVKIYDVLGREAATPLDGVKQSAGRQRVEFDATGLASGAYVARLIVNGRVVGNKKMMLVR